MLRVSEMNFSPEEQSSYIFSLSNLATLKTFYDAGVNIQDFSDYMVDINYSMKNGEEIFSDGCKQLFPTFETYSLYVTEEEEYLNKLYEEGFLSEIPEFFYELSNESLRQVFHSPYAEHIKKYIVDSNKYVHGTILYDGEIVPLSDGFGIALYSLGEYHELAQAVVRIYHESNRLYQLLKGEKR
jgi:hypothetical protein